MCVWAFSVGSGVLGCSFFVSNMHVPIGQKFNEVNHFLVKKGPDLTNRYEKESFTFVHNLLSMTGAGLTSQPFVSDDKTVVAMFNGEIYNYQNFGHFPSDGFCILPLYKQYQDTFIRHFDGEFAITVFDFKRHVIIYSTDIFATKPLWVAADDLKFGLSSYESALLRLGHKNVEEVPANFSAF